MKVPRPSPWFSPLFRLIAGVALAGPSGSALAIDFASDVQPVFKEKCFKCHSGPKAKKGLRYDDTDTLAKFIGDAPGEDIVILRGKPDESLLIEKATLPRDDAEAMPPPNRGEGFTPAELSIVKQWIADGASLEAGAPGSQPAPAMKKTDPNQIHEWTSTAGTMLKAAFVKLEDNTVHLKREDGSTLPVPMSQLAPESRRLATELAAGQ